jgi:hypothetical protein
VIAKLQPQVLFSCFKSRATRLGASAVSIIRTLCEGAIAQSTNEFNRLGTTNSHQPHLLVLQSRLANAADTLVRPTSPRPGKLDYYERQHVSSIGNNDSLPL